MRTIKRIHPALNAPIADLVTRSPLPTRHLEQVDPFIFLNHHGPQKYLPGNNGLPFGPHPHRGMETVTIILDGGLLHADNGGHQSKIGPGGIQWMTAGSGLIHSETSTEEFKRTGGQLEILQLWLNLPSSLKKTPPAYEGFESRDIPVVESEDRKGRVKLIAGRWKRTEGAHKPLREIMLSVVEMDAGGGMALPAPEGENVFFYLIRGRVMAGGERIAQYQLAEFNNDGNEIEVNADKDSIILYGHAKPINEPMVARGPFVMNTEEEIMEAYEDFQAGKFGTL